MFYYLNNYINTIIIKRNNIYIICGSAPGGTSLRGRYDLSYEFSNVEEIIK